MINLIIISSSFWLCALCSTRLMNFKGSDFVYNPKYVENGTWTLQQNGHLIQINVDFDVLITLKNVSLHLMLYEKVRGKYTKTNIYQNLIMCKFLSSNNLFSMQHYAQKVLLMGQKYSNAFVCVHKASLCFLKMNC